MNYNIIGLDAYTDPDYPTLLIRMNAQSVTLRSQVDGSLHTENNPVAVYAAINGPGPGFRDQADPFTAGQQIWFYYIWGSVNGLKGMTSAQPPSIGPTIQSSWGYTHYTPAFPFVLSPGADLIHPQTIVGGNSRIRVRGNKLFFVNSLLIDTQDTEKTFDLTALIPIGPGITVFGELDAEMFTTGSTGALAGLIFQGIHGSGENLTNLSVYLGAPGVAAQCSWIEWAIGEDRKFDIVWSIIQGTPSNYNFVFFLHGYSFPN